MGLELARDRAELPQATYPASLLGFDSSQDLTAESDSPFIASVLDVENLSRVKNMLQGN